MKRSNFLLIALLLTAVLFTQSCQKDTEEEPTAPQLPSEASFIMNFDDFQDADTTKAYNNWHHAAVNVVFWNAVIGLHGAVPLVAFAESFNHDPVYQGDNTWLWFYSYPINNVNYTANLYGKLTLTGVEWDMFISKEGGYTDFNWYSGVTSLDQTSADWVLYKSPLEPIEFVAIDYDKNEADGTAQIKYTNIIPGGPENGGYIAYGTQIDDLYDAFYDIYNKGLENHTFINWDRVSKAGRVQDQKKFGDLEWHCWGTDLRNMICP